MTRPTMRGRAVAALAAAATAAAGSVALDAAPAVASPPALDNGAYGDGGYIVVLDAPAAASYEGGTEGLAATRPAEGERIDVTGAEVQAYTEHLVEAQADVLAEVGVEPTYTYQIAFNGFAAPLTAAQALKLAGEPGVLAVLPDEVRQLDTVRSPDFLGLPGDRGVWSRLGGVDEAGKGVVVGVLDSGVWPENPSFAGDPLPVGSEYRTNGRGKPKLRRLPVGEPFLDGDQVVMQKADGTVFRGECERGEGWSSNDLCNDKLITARYFAESFLTSVPAENRSEFEYISPRDGNGHGSHTAATAAGNAGVAMSVDGIALGEGSGVAPAADLAVYKVCWEDDDDDAATGGCYTGDSVKAIEQAVIDGVDVLNYSISGTTTTVVDAVELAFYNAANAGVFVAASAGNSGPGSSTTAHNSPWVTTVGASTFKREEGTVVLGDGREYLGASVNTARLPQTELVLASDVGLAEADPAEVALCYPGTLDPALVAGTVVLCDRGVIDRVAKSAEVARAGGVAMVLGNVTPDSLDPDYHAVPTVHVDEVATAAIKAYLAEAGSPTLGFEIGDVTGGAPTPIPQVAGFSSRGPTLAAGSELIKPDVVAPGFAVVAAVAPGPNGGNDYNAFSGTSMASPHVAGLGALILGEHPDWHPSVVKSAIMTTANNLAAADGSEVTDPFVQGAGFVDPAQMLEPGLVLPVSAEEWGSFYAGQGLQLGEPDAPFAELGPTDLNYPSFAISQQTAPQTVTRTFQAVRNGVWHVQADVPGYEVTSSVHAVRGLRNRGPVSVDFTFTRTDAALAEWSTGFITLVGPTVVRMPVAVRPVSVAAPAEVAAAVAEGSVPVTVVAGFDGELPLTVAGLAEGNRTVATFPEGESDLYFAEVAEGTSFVRFDLDATNDRADLDLTVYKLNAAGNALESLAGQSASGAADERVDLLAPVPGTYVAFVDNYANAPGEARAEYAYTSYIVDPGATEGDLTATPNPLTVGSGAEATFKVSWSGLDPDGAYLGWIGYEGALSPTVVSLD